MKILTAEDADDSYDELKKTVLAKQMYGDSYLLMVDTIAQRAVITKVDGTYVADVHVALVDSTWYMWLSVDPLTDKYPGNTPYMYCDGNPIRFIDPDGRDVTLAGLNKSSVAVKTDLVNLNIDVSQLNVDFGGTYNFQGDEILSAALDIAGIFDPIGIADGLNAALQWNKGDIGGAITSAIGIVPYAGDFAKSGKIKKDVGIIDRAIDAANDGSGKFVTFIQGHGCNAKSVTVGQPEGYRKLKQMTHGGMPVYTNGKKYISPDKDGHNGGIWKMADSLEKLGDKSTRSGTYDANLNKIGD